MRMRSVIFPMTLVPTIVGVAATASALGSHEGTFEYAIDAPWRIEPVMDAQGHATYGAIPITVTIDDEIAIPMDASGRKLGNFCEMIVAGPGGSRHISLADLTEIETTGNATTTYANGAWQPDQSPPPHQVCVPSATTSCESMRNVHGTSEWYATAWYGTSMTAGQDVPLDVDVHLTRDPSIACAGATSGNIITLRNHLLVHAGEAPLPRFDNRWVYGDLHYHSQGTDNEGEAGYSYRSTVRAMGALGLDFVVASEHASDSKQIGDIDWKTVAGAPTGLETGGTMQRDMSAQRFAFLHDQLWSADGVNRKDAFDGGFGKSTQNAQSHGTAPQIYLGGEVDVIPELPANWSYRTKYPFGNNLFWDLNGSCGGWLTFGGIDSCPTGDITTQANGVTLLKDAQGFNAMYASRAHLVYIPGDGTSRTQFVASKTGVFGGGGRRLVAPNGGYGGVLPEVEANGGAVFIAHPVPGGTCDGAQPSTSGGMGPDLLAFTPTMLQQAFQSKAVVGLEFWNEDGRQGGKPGDGDLAEVGYNRPDFGHGVSNEEPSGFAPGFFELKPWSSMATRSYARKCSGIEWTLHHGAKTWDDWNLAGLMPSTASLAWLPAGEPRRLFGAGGSDAHGDLNYHRYGYTTGLEGVDDMAIGKPRNLVFAGNPDGSGGMGVGVHSQAQVTNALRNGAFSMTDGPAIRMAIDRNYNGVIDDGDTPMGGIAELYGEKTVRLVVQWESTVEWGFVDHIDLVLGGTHTGSAPNGLWAPANNGPRTASTPDVGYSPDPTGGKMRINASSLAGSAIVELPLSSFTAGSPVNRFFVRAFAQTVPRAGLKRYAFTNPIWAISPAFPAGTCPTGRPRALDRDADGLPDGCDPCPAVKGTSCTINDPGHGFGHVGP